MGCLDFDSLMLTAFFIFLTAGRLLPGPTLTRQCSAFTESNDSVVLCVMGKGGILLPVYNQSDMLAQARI